jgi:RND family efflux transporter MFP subunit
MENNYMENGFNPETGFSARKQSFIAIGIFILAGFLFTSGCSNSNSGGSNGDSQDPTNTVVSATIDSIKTKSLNVIVQGYGVTSAQQLYRIISPVTGVITNFNFFNGDHVSKGEAIASVIPKEAYSAVKGAEMLLNNAVTDAQKKEAERTLKIAEQSSNEIKIRAPFDGILVNRIKNESEVVNEGELIAGLINKNSILFIAQVPSDSIHLVKTGQSVEINFPSIHDGQFTGTVRRIEPRVNMQSQTFPVQVDIKNPGQLLADSLYGEASIIVGTHRNVFVAPQKAVIHDEEKNTYSVTLISPDSIAYTIKVVPGISCDSLVEIHSDKIKEGMPVITEGNYGLPDSTRVKVKR